MSDIDYWHDGVMNRLEDAIKVRYGLLFEDYCDDPVYQKASDSILALFKVLEEGCYAVVKDD